MATRVPPILYMYCPPKAAALLWDRRLKATSPRFLNDPFEFDPPITGKTSSAWRERHVLNKDASQEWVREEVRRHVIRMADDLKVICFSANPLDVLSWALYADRHRGFAIGFETGKIAPSNLEKIRYAKRRPPINIKSTFLADAAAKKMLWRNAIRTKSPEWKHECEYRWIVAEKWTTRGVDNNGSKAFYLPFEPACIKKLILGACCSIEKELREALSGPAYQSSCRLSKAYRDPVNFQIRARR